MMRMIVVLLLVTMSAEAAPPPRTDDVLPALRAGRWQDALPVLETIVEANPKDGRARYYLGATYQQIDRHREAIQELSASLALGVTGNRRGMRSAHIALARSLCAGGNLEGAFVHLEDAWANWGFDGLGEILEDEDFAALHGDPRLKVLAGLNPEADTGNREARWRADLRYLRRLLAVAHPEPFHGVDSVSWNGVADRLDEKIEHLSDREIVSEFMRLLASIGDGHTAVYPPVDGELAWHLLPFYPVCLEDGWFVAATPPEYAELVGARILKAAGLDWTEIVDLASKHAARDNEFTHRWLAGVVLQFAELYSLAAGHSNDREVSLLVEQSDGSQISRSLVAEDMTRNPNSHWGPSHWVAPMERAPIWLRDLNTRFKHVMLPGSRAVYVRILQTADGDDQSLADYGRELREFYVESKADALILDLRLNNGGDANEARRFMNELIRIPGIEEPESLAILVGPRSFSATGYILGMAEKHLDPIFVGWPSGCRPVGYSSERSFQLPYSGLQGSISYELRVDGDSTDDLRPAFFPDYPIWLTGEDLRQGRDPVLDTALNVLASGHANSAR